MTSYTLIATLGRSPGTVTGLYRLLYAGGRSNIDKIHLLRTKTPAIKLAQNTIEENLRPFKNLKIEFTELGEDNPTSIAAFQKIINDAIQRELEDPNRQIIIGIAGGRTSMGAMLAISAQLYDRVTHIYHLWVDLELENSGDIDTLLKLKRSNPDAYNTVLDPKDRATLLSIPNYGLAKKALGTEMQKIQSTPSISLSEIDSADYVLSLLPRRMTVEQAQQYLKIYKAAQCGDPYDELELIKLLKEAGILDIERHFNHLKTLASRPEGQPIELLGEWVNSVERDKVYWSRGLGNTYQRYREDLTFLFTSVQTSTAVISLGISLLALHLQVIGLQGLQ